MAGPQIVQISSLLAQAQTASTIVVGTGTTSTDPLVPLGGPFVHCAIAVSSDTLPLTFPSRGMAITTLGAIRIVTLAGEDVILPSGLISSGTIHPICATQVKSTSTTALGIVIFG